MIRLLVVLLLIQVSAFGQARKNYFDENGASIDSAASKWYLQERVIDNSIRRTTYYTASGLMRSQDIKDSIGTKRFYYHLNGNTKSEIRLDNRRGFPERAVLFYPDGKKQGELAYVVTSDKWLASPTLQVVNYWDSLGAQTVRDGNGVCHCFLELEEDDPYLEHGNVVDKVKQGFWKGVNQNNESFEENYADGILTSGTLRDAEGTTYQYTEVMQYAEPSGGLESFSRYVGATMKYPAKARRMGIEGKVFVDFAIEKDGTISNVKILRGISEECDAEALAVVKGYPKWVPCKLRGRIVRQRFILPISFKLQ